MSPKKLSEETYKVLHTEGTHLVESKDTDGTIRALEFKNETNKLVGPPELVKVEEKRLTPKTYDEFSPLGQIVIDMADIIVTRTADYLTEKAISSFENWLCSRKKQDKSLKNKKYENIFTRKTKIQQILESKKEPQAEIISSNEKVFQTPFAEIDYAYEEYRVNMTSEEVQKELIDIFILSILRTKKIWKVSHANIVDDQALSGEFLEGKILIEKLCSSEVIDNINALLDKKTDLLEDWEVIALSDIMGHNLVEDGHYVPIQSRKLKEALTLAI